MLDKIISSILYPELRIAVAARACGATSRNSSSRFSKDFFIDCNNHKCNSVEYPEFATDLIFKHGFEHFSINSIQFLFRSRADSCCIRVFEVENMLSNSWRISMAVLIVRKFDSDGIITGNLFNCMYS